MSEASKLFRRWMRYRCGGSRTDSGTLTLGEGGSGDTAGAPGYRGDTAPGPPSLPWALSASSGAAAPTAAPQASACSGHSPDLCWLHQGPRAPLVPWHPAQSARGARIRRHQKQAPGDTVAVHTCEAHETRPSPQPGSCTPGPLAAPDHTGPPTPPHPQPLSQAYARVRTRSTHTKHTLLLRHDTHVCMHTHHV